MPFTLMSAVAANILTNPQRATLILSLSTTGGVLLLLRLSPCSFSAAFSAAARLDEGGVKRFAKLRMGDEVLEDKVISLLLSRGVCLGGLGGFVFFCVFVLSRFGRGSGSSGSRC